jgi:hypothetical protein
VRSVEQTHDPFRNNNAVIEAFGVLFDGVLLIVVASGRIWRGGLKRVPGELLEPKNDPVQTALPM